MYLVRCRWIVGVYCNVGVFSLVVVVAFDYRVRVDIVGEFVSGFRYLTF